MYRSRLQHSLWTTLWVGVGLWIFSTSGGPLQALQPTQPPPEYQVKGALLPTLAEWTLWPSRSGVVEGGRPLVIGILGESPHLQTLSRAAGSKTVRGKTPERVLLKALNGVENCDVLFVCESEGYRLSEVLRAVRGRPILTIADTPGFAARGVMVNLIREGDRVALEVNLLVARQSGIEIGAPILKRARLVE